MHNASGIGMRNDGYNEAAAVLRTKKIANLAGVEGVEHDTSFVLFHHI